jgi:hypothetical protein
MPLNVPDRYGIAACHFATLGDSENQVITFGYQDDTAEPFGETPAQNAAFFRTALVAANRPFLAANMTTSLTFLGVKVTQFAGGLPFLGESMVSVVGTSAGQASPVSVAYLVNKGSSLGGRQGRGRMFVPGGALGVSSWTANGFLTSGARSALQTLWENFLTDTLANDRPMQILHPVLAPTPVTSLTVGPKIGAIRRRLVN